VLRNDAAAALSIAAAVGLDAIRVNVHAGAMVTDQGIVTGRAHETLRERARLGAPVLLLADVLVKHARPLGATLPDAADVARETAHRAGADGLIVSGAATGRPVDLARLREVREAVPDVPLLLGSGVTHDTVAALLDSADGVIVGSALKEGGVVSAPVAIERVRALVESARTRHGRR
jgi:hypothetical protein